MSSLKRKLVLLIVPILLVAGVAGAYAASQTSAGSPRKAFLNDLARRLDVTPQRLRKALDGAYSDQLTAAVAAGRLSKAQAKAIEQRLKKSGAVPFGGVTPFGGRKGFGWPPRSHVVAPRGKHAWKPGAARPGGLPGWRAGAHARGAFARPRYALGFGLLGSDLNAVTGYLGISTSTLRSELRSGKSLAEIATAHGKTAAGLEAAIETATRSALAKQVAARRLTKAQEQSVLSHIDARIPAIVHAKLRAIANGVPFHLHPLSPSWRGGPGAARKHAKAGSGKVSSLFAPA